MTHWNSGFQGRTSAGWNSSTGLPWSSGRISYPPEAAGALGLLIGIAVPLIGLVAAGGLTLFFVGAIITHLRARDYSLGRGMPVVFLLIAAAALVIEVSARKMIL